MKKTSGKIIYFLKLLLQKHYHLRDNYQVNLAEMSRGLILQIIETGHVRKAPKMSGLSLTQGKVTELFKLWGVVTYWDRVILLVTFPLHVNRLPY